MRRTSDLDAIAKALSGENFHIRPNAVVALGDSLALLARIPSSSVRLIVTDPPYHTTKKANITGDRSFESDAAFLSWMEAFAAEFHRILKPNGAAYIFCSSDMSGRLEVTLSRHLRPLNNITWTKPNEPGFDGWKGKMNKEALRRWYPHSERILHFEQSVDSDQGASPLAVTLRTARKAAGLTSHQLTGLIGAFGAVNRGGAVSNWETGRNIPSPEQYAKLRREIESTGKISMPDYQDAVRPFSVNSAVQFTDVWDFPSVRPYPGKHPAEKPAEMIQHIIDASSFSGDVVLDCFSGSGVTAAAAIELGRQAVAIEIEPDWVSRTLQRIDEAIEASSNGSDASAVRGAQALERKARSKTRQVPLRLDFSQSNNSH